MLMGYAGIRNVKDKYEYIKINNNSEIKIFKNYKPCELFFREYLKSEKIIVMPILIFFKNEIKYIPDFDLIKYKEYQIDKKLFLDTNSNIIKWEVGKIYLRHDNGSIYSGNGVRSFIKTYKTFRICTKYVGIISGTEKYYTEVFIKNPNCIMFWYIKNIKNNGIKIKLENIYESKVSTR